MKDFIKRTNWLNVCIATALLIIGILFAVLDKEGAKVVCHIVGASLIVFGLAGIIYSIVKGFVNSKWEFPIGCLGISLGIILMIKIDVFTEIIPLIFGLILVTDGFSKFKDSLVLFNKKWNKWWILLIISLIYLNCGWLSIFLNIDKAYLIIGIFAIVISTIDIAITIAFYNKQSPNIKNDSI